MSDQFIRITGRVTREVLGVATFAQAAVHVGQAFRDELVPAWERAGVRVQPGSLSQDWFEDNGPGSEQWVLGLPVTLEVDAQTIQNLLSPDDHDYGNVALGLVQGAAATAVNWTIGEFQLDETVGIIAPRAQPALIDVDLQFDVDFLLEAITPEDNPTVFVEGHAEEIMSGIAGCFDAAGAVARTSVQIGDGFQDGLSVTARLTVMHADFTQAQLDALFEDAIADTRLLAVMHR